MMDKKAKKDKILYRKFDLTDSSVLSKLKMKNVYIDYESGGKALESVPGYRRICSMNEEIHSVFRVTDRLGKEYLYLHSGNGLYRFEIGLRDSAESLSKIAELKNRKSHCISHCEHSFITDGDSLFGFDEAGDAMLISDDPKIAGCSVMEIYDGRLFLAGNPNEPNKIFYSTPLAEDLPHISGEMTVSGGEISEMISLGGYLWIFRAKGHGAASRLAPMDDEKENYCTNEMFFGLNTFCAAACLDRIFILTKNGVYSLENAPSDSPYIRLMAEIPRAMLKDSEMPGAKLGFWMGYVAIMSPGKILLLDTHANPCTIFPILDIGDYFRDFAVFRYSGETYPGYRTHRETDSIAYGEVFSLMDSDGSIIYYEKQGENRFLLYPTEERRGGKLIPSNGYFCSCDLMWFYAEGELFLFNNDKRGTPPEAQSDKEEIADYENLLSGGIHPKFYSFAGHSPECIIALPTEYGESIDQRKRTLPGALLVECKNLIKSSAELVVMSDGVKLFSQKISGSITDFSKMDFSMLAKSDESSFTIALTHRGPSWKYKKIIIRNQDFCTPMAIISVSHRFLIQN